MRLLVINGPNINMLGIREVNIYGSENYKDLLNLIDKTEKELKITIDHFQSNHEGCIVDEIQKSFNKYDGLIINAAAYTHTSIAILDAIKAVRIPTVEVHISEVSKREDFRQVNFIRKVAIKNYEGLGIQGYREAIMYLYKYLGEKNEDINNR